MDFEGYSSIDLHSFCTRQLAPSYGTRVELQPVQNLEVSQEWQFSPSHSFQSRDIRGDLEGRKLLVMAAHTFETQQKQANLPSQVSLDHLLAIEKEGYGHKLQVLGTRCRISAPKNGKVFIYDYVISLL